MNTVLRIVLSKVPTAMAGVGSGVLITTQQTALAVGVAVFGSLFASLSLPESMDIKGAFLLVMALQLILSVGVMFFSRRLPDPRG